MGYDFHITRASSWADNAKHQISSDEWLAYIDNDPELALAGENGPYFALWTGRSGSESPWLDWSDGNIYSKNPDSALVDKMVVVARELRAQVQGDDGEIYRNGHESPVQPRASIRDRVRGWVQGLRPEARLTEISPFHKTGDRVWDVFGKEATVVDVDLQGLGRVKVRYNDGKEAVFAVAASGLRPINPRSD